MMKTIWKVDSVHVVNIGGGKFRIDAVGTTGTAGWTHPAIVGAGIISGGNLDYEFQAVPPPGMALQVLTPVSASAEIGGPGTSLNGLTTIRVFASQGHYDVPFSPVCR